MDKETKNTIVTILKKAMYSMTELQSFGKANPGVRLPASEQHYSELSNDLMDVIQEILK